MAKADLVCHYIISRLATMPPSQAAQWIVSQKHKEAIAVASRIAITPDDQVEDLLEAASQTNPDFGALTDWLRSRMPWVIQTKQELARRIDPALLRRALGAADEGIKVGL